MVHGALMNDSRARYDQLSCKVANAEAMKTLVDEASGDGAVE